MEKHHALGSSDSEDDLPLCEKMNNVRRNKEPEKILNVSYRDILKQFTAYNTENIYLDNAYIQQVAHCVNSDSSHHKRPSSTLTAGLLRSFPTSKRKS